MRRFVNGIASLIAIAAVLVGVPALLILVAGNPLPTPEQWSSMMSFTPDYGSQIFLTKFIPCIAWLAWLLFAVPFLIELFGAVSGWSAPRLPVFRGQQQLAATLITAVALMFAGGLAIGGPAPAANANEAHGPSASTTTAAQTLEDTVEDVETAVPPAAATPAPAPTVDEERVVQSGDTLWGIAEEELGDGNRYPDIAAASNIADPSYILPGWNVTIPGVATAAPAPAPAPAPEPAPAETPEAVTPDVAAPAEAPVAQGGAGGAAGGTEQAATATPSPSSSGTSSGAGDDAADVDEIDEAIPLRTAGGIGGILAAGLLGALGMRRLVQRRRRKTNERIAMPDPESEISSMEMELRMVENLELEDIDHVMRGLQIWAEETDTALPHILAVRLEASEIALYLTEPADLPAPFVLAAEDRTAWIVKPGTAIAPVRKVVSPYPALASIGTDAAGGVLLIDLEELGALSVTGDEEVARGILNALSVELAENPWSDEIQVTLVGMPAGLARDLNAFRVSHVDDVDTLMKHIRADLDRRAEIFAEDDLDGARDARVTSNTNESWAPHVIILGEVPDAEVQEELAELVARVPRLGLATVSNWLQAKSSELHVESIEQATVTTAGGPPLPFIPQALMGRELELIHGMFATTTAPAAPAPAPLVEVPVEAAVSEATTAAETPAEAFPVPVGQEADVETEEAFDGATDHDVDDAVASSAPDWIPPYVRILGPVDVSPLADPDAMPERGPEVMAYLALTSPVSGATFGADFYPNSKSQSNSLRQGVKRVRNGIGRAPDGESLIPENNARKGYRIHDAVRSDWGDFKQLIGPDLRKTSNDDLVAALRLVRGQPFAGVNTQRWWHWIGIHQETMIAEILDAADELGRRALENEDVMQTRFAAKVSQTVEPAAESGWRNEMRAAWLSRDINEFQTIVTKLNSFLDSFDDDYDMEPETQELVAEAMADLQR
jgi:LysM repeat protein